MAIATPPATGTRTMTYVEALNEGLREEMRRDPGVFVMGEDVAVWGGGGVFGVTKGLIDEFGPERVRDTPISEEAIAAVAIGAALTGSRPVAEIMYVDFIGLAMEPIVNPPETAILGVGRIADKAVVVDGRVESRTMCSLSLSFDHRVVD